MTDNQSKRIRELEKEIAVTKNEVHRLDAIESEVKDLKGIIYDMKSTLDNLTGGKKMAVWILGFLGTVMALIIAWLNTK